MATRKPERLLNLVICLMSAKQFVTAEYLRSNVVGYNDADQHEDTFKRMFERDKAELRELGIPVITGHNPLGGDEGYRILREDYGLPDISLERDEAAAIAAASALWHDPEVATISQTALLKLQAAGFSAESDGLGFVVGRAARSMGDETVIREILAAIDAGRAITFTHRNTGQRTLEPWGVVSNGGRWYVVGHDRGRDDVRTFRISRITDASATGAEGAVTVPPGRDLAAIVAEAVERASSDGGVVARVWIADGSAHQLRLMASERSRESRDGVPGEVVTIEITSRSALVRAILWAGAGAVVLEPDDLRETVIASLRGALAAGEF